MKGLECQTETVIFNSVYSKLLLFLLLFFNQESELMKAMARCLFLEDYIRLPT